jgi:hypothetical protein
MRRIFVLATLLVVSSLGLLGSQMAPSVSTVSTVSTASTVSTVSSASTLTAVRPRPHCDGSQAPC